MEKIREGNDIIEGFRLVVCGNNQLQQYDDAKFTHVISLLDPDTSVPDIPGADPDHRRLILSFHDVGNGSPPIIPPTAEHMESIFAFADGLRSDLEAGHDGLTLVHSDNGISRAPAAGIALLARLFPGMEAVTLLIVMSAIQPDLWPNQRMITLLDELIPVEGDITAEYQRWLPD